MPLKMKQKAPPAGTPRAIDRFHKYGWFFSVLLTILNVVPLTAYIEIFHNMSYANQACRRQIEKSLFAQIEMSLSTASVGEYWADDGDYDEPDGDRPDGRIARSGRWQDQDRRGVVVEGAWSASGVPAGEGLRQAWS